MSSWDWTSSMHHQFYFGSNKPCIQQTLKNVQPSWIQGVLDKVCTEDLNDRLIHVMN